MGKSKKHMESEGNLGSIKHIDEEKIDMGRL